MKNLKRIAWVLSFAGCCGVGLLLLAGERSAGPGPATYCPSVFYGTFNGIYMFGAYSPSDPCNGGLPYYYPMGDTRMHQLSDCPDCPDPIVTSAHPLPVELPEQPLVPQADPRFSGMLR